MSKPRRRGSRHRSLEVLCLDKVRLGESDRLSFDLFENASWGQTAYLWDGDRKLGLMQVQGWVEFR